VYESKILLATVPHNASPSTNTTGARVPQRSAQHQHQLEDRVAEMLHALSVGCSLTAKECAQPADE